MTNDQASARFHASFGIVVQLVLPGVHLSWTNIEAWFLFAFLTKLRIYYNERLGVFVEAHEGQAFVEAHFFLFLRHFLECPRSGKKVADQADCGNLTFCLCSQLFVDFSLPISINAIDRLRSIANQFGVDAIEPVVA